MPNRILRESICTSQTIEGLSWFEEVCFYRLIVQCDDFGRLDARVPILRSKLFPLKENLDRETIEAAMQALADAGLIERYECGGKPYLQLVTWGQYQRVRNQRSKYPSPEDALDELLASVVNCPSESVS